MGSFGVERKNILNNLFKQIIEVTVPNFVRYLFWGSASGKGIFDEHSSMQAYENAERKKKLSKY